MPHVPRRSSWPSQARVVWGYVYLIKMNGVHKIGCCKSWRNRSKAYSGMPFPVVLVCLLRTYCQQKLEQELHKKYDRKRMSGEWFNLDQREVDEICNHPLRVEREE